MFMPMFNKYLKYVNNPRAYEKSVICRYLHEMFYQDQKYYDNTKMKELQKVYKNKEKKIILY